MAGRLGWQPQDDLCFAFSDETAEDRSPEQIDGFIEALREVAGKHGFDLSTVGTKPAFARFLHKQFDGEIPL